MLCQWVQRVARERERGKEGGGEGESIMHFQSHLNLSDNREREREIALELIREPRGREREREREHQATPIELEFITGMQFCKRLSARLRVWAVYEIHTTVQSVKFSNPNHLPTLVKIARRYVQSQAYKAASSVRRVQSTHKTVRTVQYIDGTYSTLLAYTDAALPVPQSTASVLHHKR